jgi:hypothetical protein
MCWSYRAKSLLGLRPMEYAGLMDKLTMIYSAWMVTVLRHANEIVFEKMFDEVTLNRYEPISISIF